MWTTIWIHVLVPTYQAPLNLNPETRHSVAFTPMASAVVLRGQLMSWLPAGSANAKAQDLSWGVQAYTKQRLYTRSL